MYSLKNPGRLMVTIWILNTLLGKKLYVNLFLTSEHPLDVKQKKLKDKPDEKPSVSMHDVEIPSSEQDNLQSVDILPI